MNTCERDCPLNNTHNDSHSAEWEFTLVFCLCLRLACLCVCMCVCVFYKSAKENNVHLKCIVLPVSAFIGYLVHTSVHSGISRDDTSLFESRKHTAVCDRSCLDQV